MLNTMTLECSRMVINLQEKARRLLKIVCGLKETHKSFITNCAVTYMAIKVGLILLATFATMVLLISIVSRHLAIEMSKEKAVVFALPLTLIIVLKLYFIFRMLMAYDRARLAVKSVINGVLLRERQGIQRIGETFPVDLSPLSLKKVRNR
ncbi:MAG: hypothetical protein KGI30_06330 [Planctomycetota bacterium]|nr:hypothetical protein [Planctomycetota bacterium]